MNSIKQMKVIILTISSLRYSTQNIIFGLILNLLILVYFVHFSDGRFIQDHHFIYGASYARRSWAIAPVGVPQ